MFLLCSVEKNESTQILNDMKVATPSVTLNFITKPTYFFSLLHTVVRQSLNFHIKRCSLHGNVLTLKWFCFLLNTQIHTEIHESIGTHSRKKYYGCRWFLTFFKISFYQNEQKQKNNNLKHVCNR